MSTFLRTKPKPYKQKKQYGISVDLAKTCGKSAASTYNKAVRDKDTSGGNRSDSDGGSDSMTSYKYSGNFRSTGRGIERSSSSGNGIAFLSSAKADDRQYFGPRFRLMELPYDVQQYIFQFLLTTELGRTLQVCSAWKEIYDGAVQTIFVEAVGAPKPTFNLGRTELTLIYRLRHCHIRSHATQVLMWAAKQDYVGLIRRLVKNDPKILDCSGDAADFWDRGTPLHVAAQNRSTAAARALVELGADVNRVNKDKKTPLHVACERGSISIVELLLKVAPDTMDINAPMADGRTVLHTVAYRNFKACLGLLLRAHYDCVQRAIADQKEKFPGIVEEDIDVSPYDGLILNLNAQSEQGTPLCVACKRNNLEIAARLLDANLSNEDYYKDREQKEGKEREEEVYQHPHSGGTSQGRRQDADVNAKTDDGATPLFVSCERG